MSFEFNGKIIETDEEGFLLNMSDWSRELAVFMAQQDGYIELTPAHWEIIDLVREWYAEYETSPNHRVLTKLVAKSLGRDKGNTKYLQELFPWAPGKDAARYSGLDKPVGEV